MSTALFLTFLILHVLAASIWIGATLFMTVLLMPAMGDAGPAGGQIMMALSRKGLVPFFASVSGTTVLTGLYLFWHFTEGFDGALSASHAGMAYSVGGAAGFLAAIIGGSVVGRSSKKAVELMARIATLKDGPEKAGLVQQVDVLGHRMSSFGRIVILMQVVAAVLMTVALYL